MYQYTEKQLIDKSRTLIFDFLSSQNRDLNRIDTQFRAISHNIVSKLQSRVPRWAHVHEGPITDRRLALSPRLDWGWPGERKIVSASIK